jgi:hypothetical protein
MQRQRQLERCGWEFFRVRESAFYASRENAMKGLWQALEERGILSESSCLKVSSHRGMTDDVCDEINSNAAEEDDDIAPDEGYLFPDSGDGLASSVRRPDEVAATEIQDAIVRVLSNCPNQSCTIQSLATRVLREVGVLTRGNPRLEFEKRVMRSLGMLETKDVVERYRAKNKRVRLI